MLEVTRLSFAFDLFASSFLRKSAADAVFFLGGVGLTGFFFAAMLQTITHLIHSPSQLHSRMAVHRLHDAAH